MKTRNGVDREQQEETRKKKPQIQAEAQREEPVEGAMRKDGRLPRKQHPRWYCDQRKMVGLPFVWHRFLPGAPQVGVPIGGSAVLVATRGMEGKLLRIPRQSLYDETVEFLRKEEAKWWAYMPEMPMFGEQETRVLGSRHFYYCGNWKV